MAYIFEYKVLLFIKLFFALHLQLLNQDGELKTEEIHVAVKTCSHFHDERLPVIKDTWLPDAPNHALYSDREGVVLCTVNFVLSIYVV